MLLELAQHLVWAGQAAASDSEEGINNLALLFLASGFVFYGAIYLKYRNVNKRHKHETETKAEIANVQASDTFFRSRTGLTNSRMQGANNTAVRGSLNRLK